MNSESDKKTLAAMADLLERTGEIGKIGGWEIDLKTRTFLWSKEVCRIHDLDYTPTLEQGLSFFLPESRPLIDAAFKAAVDFGTPYDLELQKTTAKGRVIWVRVQGFAVFEDSKVCKLRGVIQDISERRQAEAHLKLAASVFTHAREVIIITDSDGLIVEVNAAFSYISGYSREEAIGQNPRMLKSGRQAPEVYADMWQALTEKGHWSGELWNRKKDGELYVVLSNISAVRNGLGAIQNYVGLFTDITAMKKHAQGLERIVHFDALTGLPNRVLLADRLKQSIIQSQRHKTSLAVVFLDLDGFKSVNDMHGHEAGDQLLIALAQRMKLTLRDGDTLARIGGDEFVAVLADLDTATDCHPLLARLLQAASQPVTAGHKVLQVSASIGVTIYPADLGDADLLLRHADQAMYEAKQQGKNRYHRFDIAQNAAIQSRDENADEIQKALGNREFVLFYQPKVNLASGQVTGVEALIRWQHPQRGLLPPFSFLPSIDDHPISLALGEWVIDTALAQVAQWYSQGLCLPVSVNVSAYQLQEGNFAERLSALLRAHPQVSPSSLEVEILESSAMADVAKVSEVMLACQALGVQFALDDFGTGYSSLSHLKYLPAKTLKIDRCFVRDILEDPNDLAIVKGVIGLANAFDRHVIAEGVETIAHGILLLSVGCAHAQGYGIAYPMPAEDLPGWVASWKTGRQWAAWKGLAVS